MKRHINILSTIFIGSILAACSSGGVKTGTSSTDAKNVKVASYDKVFQVISGSSIIGWEGSKPARKHHGAINLISGELGLKEGKIVGGEFVIDMNSIKDLDLEDTIYNAKLTRHLKSADFFEVATYPTAKFIITDVKPVNLEQIAWEETTGEIVPTHTITGNLTIKGTTKSITFNALINFAEDKIEAKTNQFFIDRSEWNVRYGSRKFFDNLKDKFINDEIGITINLVTSQRND